MQLDDEQLKCIEQTGKSLVVTAGAGSGKTTVLVERYIKLVTEVTGGMMTGPERVVAITFTEKAAAQMRSRVTEALRKKIEDDPKSAEASGLKDILEGLPAARISTIDSFCMNIVRHYPMYAGVHPEFAVLEPSEADRVRHECIQIAMDEVLSSLDEESRQEVAALVVSACSNIGLFLRQIDKRVNEAYTMRTHKKAGDMSDTNRHLAQMKRRAIELFEDRMADLKALDFAMIEDRALKVLEQEAGEEIRRGIEQVLVDEYQDVNTVQDKIVRLLTAREGINERQILKDGKLFIVGDPKQSIYRFRGSEPDIFARWISEAESISQHIRLRRNYRSNPLLIDFSNRLFSKVLREQHQDSEAGRSGFTANGKSLVRVIACPKADGEDVYMRTADEILALAGAVKSGKKSGEERPIGFKDIALLTPSNDGMDPYIAALRAKGIPVAVMKGGTFYTSASVAFITSLFGIALNSADDISAYQLLASPVYGIRDATIANLSSRTSKLSRCLTNVSCEELKGCFIDEDELSSYESAKQAVLALRDIRSSCGTRQILERLADEEGLERSILRGYGRRGVANYRKLIELAGNTALKLGNPLDFLSYLINCRADKVEADEPDILDDDEEAVKVMTIHKAKGLEFPVVILGEGNYDLEREPKWTDTSILSTKDGGIVTRKSTGAAKSIYEEILKKYIEENSRERRRLMYVAATRAEEMLVISDYEMSKNIDKDTKRPVRLERYLFKKLDSITQWTAGGVGSPVIEWISDMQQTADMQAERALYQAEQEGSTQTQGMLERTNDRIVRFSPSSMMLYLSCRKEFLRKQWYRLPEDHADYKFGEGKPKNGYKASELGVIVHYIAQHSEGMENAKEAFRKAEAFFGRKLTCNDALLSKVNALASNYHSFIEQKRPAGRLMKEVAFTLELGKYVLEGLIDRLEEDDQGGWIVTDYKTNNLDKTSQEALERKYDVQLKSYMLAARKALDNERIRARLLFLAEGITAESGNPDFKAIEKELLGIMEEASVLPEKCRVLSQACEGCIHRSTCPEGYRFAEELDLYETGMHAEADDNILQ